MNLKPSQLGMCMERKCKHEAGVFVEIDKLEQFNPLVLGLQVMASMADLMKQPCPMCPKNDKKAKSSKKR